MRDHRLRPDRALGIEAPSPLFLGAIPNNGWDRPYIGVRTDRYTYVEYTETGDRQLFDRREDPYEIHNLAGLPDYEELEATLARKAAKLGACVGEDCSKIKP